MKKYIIWHIIFSFVFIGSCFGQNYPDWISPGWLLPSGVNNSIPGPITNIIALPSAYNAGANPSPTKFNYKRIWHPLARTTNEAGITTSSSTLFYPMSTTYYDGFSRKMEIIDRYKNTSDSSLVTFYDNRPSSNSINFLPYSVYGDARFQMDPFDDQQSYFLNRFPNEMGTSASEKSEYSDANTREAIYLTPGKSTLGQNRGTTVSLGGNQNAEIQIWSVSSASPYWPQTGGTYASDQLIKKISQNADGAQVQEYYNSDDQLICRRVLTSPNNYDITYYVYDFYNRLTYVLTPKATQYLAANSWSPTATIINNLSYFYLYDAFGRIIETHKPGENGNDYFVYDSHDRKVLTQSPQLSSLSQWQFTLYDAFDRKTVTGILNNSWSQSFFQHMVDVANDPSFVNSPGLGYYITNSVGEGQYPLSINYSQINSYNYYDNYSFVSPYPVLTGYNSSVYSGISSTLYSIPPVQAQGTKGFLTGVISRVLKPSTFTVPGVNDWIVSANYYDDYGRVLQCQTINHRNGLDLLSRQYDFQGNKVAEITNHQNPVSTVTPSTNVITMYATYNTTNKLHGINYAVNGVSAPQISSLSYNGLGQITHNVIGTVEDQFYDYTIGGQLTGINTDYAESGNADGNMVSFGESIKYDRGFTQHLYCGGVSGIYWKGAGSSPQKSYAYTYDNASRLLNADYKEFKNIPYYSLPGGGTGGGPIWTNADNDYSERGISYDANGNIKTLQRYGPLASGGHGMIDNLNYSYLSGDQSNTLQSIDDAVPAAATTITPYDFKDISGATDYQYADGNGNITADANKGTTTTYNYLNLPSSLSFTSGDNISYVYDASGNKLMSILQNSAGSTVTDYIGKFQYKNNTLNEVNNEAGYAHSDASGFNYYFYVKDHLGNVRNILKAIPSTLPPTQYFASHELAFAAFERVIFQNLDSVREYKPLSPGMQDQYAALLDGSDPNKTVGTAILLNVMAGDRFDLAAQSYYDPGPQNLATVQPPQILNAIISTLTGGIVGNNQEGNASTIIPNIFTPANYMGVYDSIINTNTDSSIPQAYLNYVAFDENFNIVPENCGAIQVGATPSTWNAVGTISPITINRDGYFAAYLSTREAGMPVYFDAVGITHYSGGLVQENQYYPFGLPVNVAQVDPTNNNLFQTKEEDVTDGLYLDNFNARQYDAQIGRFTSLDPMNQFNSGYTGMGNNPIRVIDPTGQDGWLVDKESGEITYTGMDNVIDQNSAEEAGFIGYKYMGTAGFGLDNPNAAGEQYLVHFNADGTKTPYSLGETTVHGMTGVSGASTGESEGTIALSVTGLALDAHNVAMDGAAVLSKTAGDAMKVATRTTGLVGVALGGGMAIHDMINNGVNASNLTSLSLAVVSGAILAIPGIGEAAEALSLSIEAVSLTVDGATIIKDTYDMAHKH